MCIYLLELNIALAQISIFKLQENGLLVRFHEMCETVSGRWDNSTVLTIESVRPSGSGQGQEREHELQHVCSPQMTLMILIS